VENHLVEKDAMLVIVKSKENVYEIKELQECVRFVVPLSLMLCLIKDIVMFVTSGEEPKENTKKYVRIAESHVMESTVRNVHI